MKSFIKTMTFILYITAFIFLFSNITYAVTVNKENTNPTIKNISPEIHTENPNLDKNLKDHNEESSPSTKDPSSNSTF